MNTNPLQPERNSAPLPIRVGLAVAAGFLLWHVWSYWFLCDDAFISFRYARNLSEGHGLLFNPGFERAEGYTNFLWVTLLAGLNTIGFLPEYAAPVCSAICGLALWWICARYCLQNPPPRSDRKWLLLIVPIFLAANRSYAVWCTSGLETKFFELLVVAGVLRTLREIDLAASGTPNPRPFGALLLALACLTRPDGVLIFGCVFVARMLVQLRAGSLRAAPIINAISIFALFVGGHLVFRLGYYGEWLPNTYYAKVGGETWWSMGGKYFAAFGIEYAAWVWLPLVLMGAWALFGDGWAATPLLIGAVVIPHAIYVAAIGGDHFEYRPIDLYFPLLFILLYHGAVFMARSRMAAALTGLYLALSLFGSILFPALTKWGAPKTYTAGFPGANARADGSRDAVSRETYPWLFSVPVLGRLADTYNDLLIETSKHFVGLRQPEHKLFVERVTTEGRRLADAIENGLIDANLYLAIDCVGAIPYYSRLRTLDRLGLTDRDVARGKMYRPEFRLMAHDKIASISFGRKMGVDVWATDGESLVLPIDHPAVLYYAHASERSGLQMIGRPLDGADWAIGIHPAGDAQFDGRLVGWQEITPALLADMMAKRETGTVSIDGNLYARLHLYFGARLQKRDMARAAADHFRRAVLYDPGNRDAHALLGDTLAALRQYDGALQAMNRALELAPRDMEVANNLAWLLATCPESEIRDGQHAVKLAESVAQATGGTNPAVLDTLAAALAEAGRFDRAVTVAEQARAIAEKLGADVLARDIAARTDLYRAGNAFRESPNPERPDGSNDR